MWSSLWRHFILETWIFIPVSLFRVQVSQMGTTGDLHSSNLVLKMPTLLLSHVLFSLAIVVLAAVILWGVAATQLSSLESLASRYLNLCTSPSCTPFNWISAFSWPKLLTVVLLLSLMMFIHKGWKSEQWRLNQKARTAWFDTHSVLAVADSSVKQIPDSLGGRECKTG